MDLIRFLRNETGANGTKLVLAGLFTGIVNAALVAVVITVAGSASKGGADFRDLALFALCLAGYVLGKQYALSQTSSLAARIVAKLRLRILDGIRQSELLLFEKIGKTPIYTTLSTEATTLSESVTFLITAFSSAIMLCFSLVYIGLLSMHAFGLTLLCLAAGVFVYTTSRREIIKVIQRTTLKEHEFFGYLSHLLEGFKEVRMNEDRNRDLYDNYLVRSAHEVKELKVSSSRQFARLSIFAQTFFYLLIGSIIFLLPIFSPANAGSTVQVASVILFVMGPLTEIVSAVPYVMKGNAALANIHAMESQLQPRAGTTQNEMKDTDGAFSATFRELRCERITFQYDAPEGEKAFGIGPLDLSIRAGEILFIVGGNGSGKSTFLKVLTGLYPHRSGALQVDGKEIGEGNQAQYRSLFSTVFTDFHLFDRLYGLEGTDRGLLQALIKQMDLAQKTGVNDGRFITIDLSTGQKKRLAVIVALLENRPLLIFDEVAADQDPEFRRYFYRVFLQELRQSGKTIVAATHDDAYFDVADRVVKMEYGKFIDTGGPDNVSG